MKTNRELNSELADLFQSFYLKNGICCENCNVPPIYDYQENCKLCGLYGTLEKKDINSLLNFNKIT